MGKELLDVVEFLVHNVEVFCLHSWVGGVGEGMGVGVGWRKGRKGRIGRRKEKMYGEENKGVDCALTHLVLLEASVDGHIRARI